MFINSADIVNRSIFQPHRYKFFKRAKRYAAIALTLALSFVMGIKAVPVHAEEESERIEGVQSEINIISTNRVIDYQVILQDRYGDTTILMSCTNVSSTISLKEFELFVGDKVIIQYGYYADYMNEKVEIDPTNATFSLDDYISSIGDPIDEVLEGVVPEVDIISTNSDIYYQVCLYEKYGNVEEITSVKNDSSSVNLKELELLVGERVFIHWGYSADNILFVIEIDVTKAEFDLDEHVRNNATSVKVTVTSTTEAAKAIQFHFYIGDSFYTGSKFTDYPGVEPLVFTGTMNERIEKVMFEDGDKPFIKLLDENKTEIEFETIEDGNLFINLDNYVKQVGDDYQKTETEDLESLYMSGQALISEGKIVGSFPKGANYDIETNTLTLDNYTGEVVDTLFSDIDSDDEYYNAPRYGIYAKGGALKINLVGENNITNSEDNGTSICGDETDITITGDGILNLNGYGGINCRNLNYTGSGSINIQSGSIYVDRDMTLSGAGTVNINNYGPIAIHAGCSFTMDSGSLNINLSYESEYKDVTYNIYGITTRFLFEEGYEGEPSPQFNFNGGTVSITGEEDGNNIYIGIDAQGGNMKITNTTIKMDLNGIWNMGVGVGNYSSENEFIGGELSFADSTLDIHMRAGYAAYFGELIGAEDIYYYTGADKLTSVSFDDIFKHNWIDERYDYVSESELRLVMSSTKLEVDPNDNTGGGIGPNDGNNNTDKPNQSSDQATKASTTKTTTSPKTGDNSNTMLYVVLLVFSGMLIIMRKKLFSLIR